jgi:hypothetical protein
VVDATTAANAVGPGRFAGARSLVVVQVYVVAAYVAAAIVPYLWRGHAAPPVWTWAAAGWVLGVPGFWVVVLGPALAIPLALAGAGVLALRRVTLPRTLRSWLIGATALMAAYALFSYTPLAHAILVWVID